jgi:hypothetical protein
MATRQAAVIGHEARHLGIAGFISSLLCPDEKHFYLTRHAAFRKLSDLATQKRAQLQEEVLSNMRDSGGVEPYADQANIPVPGDKNHGAEPEQVSRSGRYQ